MSELSDGKWHSLSELVLKLGKRIPAAAAYRNSRSGGKDRYGSMEAAVATGRRALVRLSARLAIARGEIEVSRRAAPRLQTRGTCEPLYRLAPQTKP
jgi:hypothetical protein